MITLDSAINRIAERTVENRRFWKQAINQRRNTFVDIYSVPYELKYQGKSGDDYIYETHISISPDMEYYERFLFKLEVHTASTIDDFEVDYGFLPNEEGVTRFVDITDYLIVQNGDLDDWITGDGFYPTEAEDEETPYEADFFNMLEVADSLMAEGRESDKNRLTRSGMHIMRVKSDVRLDSVTALLFLKYSVVNR